MLITLNSPQLNSLLCVSARYSKCLWATWPTSYSKTYCISLIKNSLNLFPLNVAIEFASKTASPFSLCYYTNVIVTLKQGNPSVHTHNLPRDTWYFVPVQRSILHKPGTSYSCSAWKVLLWFSPHVIKKKVDVDDFICISQCAKSISDLDFVIFFWPSLFSWFMHVLDARWANIWSSLHIIKNCSSLPCSYGLSVAVLLTFLFVFIINAYNKVSYKYIFCI